MQESLSFWYTDEEFNQKYVASMALCPVTHPNFWGCFKCCQGMRGFEVGTSRRDCFKRYNFDPRYPVDCDQDSVCRKKCMVDSEKCEYKCIKLPGYENPKVLIDYKK